MNEGVPRGAEDERPPAHRFPVVGLGASAGGIQALRTFFENVPANSGHAYVVILHLSPDHESQLAPVLQSVCRMPVTQVTRRVRVEPDHVYVIAPDQHLSMSDGHIEVAKNTSLAERRAPVDIFFRTLAETQGPEATCVVLSGTGANGSMGLRHIKERGGAAFVQDPRESEWSEMPQNSIATGLVDDILPVAQIPAKIMAYRSHLGAIKIPIEPEARAPDDQEALREVFLLLRSRTGHDFSNYKRATLLRRIERRIHVHVLPDLQSYVGFLRENEGETQALLNDILISVTSFFRDPEKFRFLEEDLVPQIIAGKRALAAVRIWVIGCATGEEAYSIAILCAERTMDMIDAPKVQIFATDIDQHALGRAREGVYSLNDAADVSPELLRRYFARDGSGYRVRREVREMILFANHNVIRDPPFSHIDLVMCRNVMIYFDAQAQERVLETAHFALNPDGYLMLGTSESIGEARDLFNLVPRQAHLFQRRPGQMRRYPIVADRIAGLGTRLSRVIPHAETTRHEPMRASFVDFHQNVLERYAPPSLLISDAYDIVHMSERAGRYLQHSGGELSSNLLDVIRPELRLELRTALYQAASRKTNVEVRDLKITIDGVEETINIHVRPVPSASAAANAFLLVIFAPTVATESDEERVFSSDEPVVRQLEDELVQLKHQLRSTDEVHEAQAEELKASNEELQAMNEELRSAAEELETSREELQSINEELTTVNQELKVKIDEAAETSNNLLNLVNSTDIATIFLDREGQVHLFSPAVRQIFNLLDTDVGRPLTDITSRLQPGSDFVDDAKRVLENLNSIEREVRTTDDNIYLMRLMPYRTADQQIQGVVATFTQITARKRAEEAIIESQARLLAITDLVPDLLWSSDAEGRADWFNQGWVEYTGLKPDGSSGQGWMDLIHPVEREATWKAFQQAMKTGEPIRFEHRLRSADGDYHWFLVNARPQRDAAGKIIRWFGAATNIHELRLAHEALRASEERLRLTVESVTDYAIFTTDASGTIDSWNAGARRTFGWTEAEAIGQKTDIIFTPEDRAAGAPQQEMSTAAEKGRAADELWHLRKDGSRFYVSGVMTALRRGGVITGFAKIARDLTEQKTAGDELQRAREELEVKVQERTSELAAANESLREEIIERQRAEEARLGLLQQLVNAQEGERRRISRELHDQLGQQVTALSLKLTMLRRDASLDPDVRTALEGLEGIAKEIDGDLDFLVWELRPTALDDLGLHEALSDYLDTWSRHFGVPARLRAKGVERPRLKLEFETVLYRIAQEALNNISKHAQATQVDMALVREDGEVVFTIVDDGVGFTPEQPFGAGSRGLGLVGMRERAALVGGTIEIASQPGAGTRIVVRLPLVPAAKKGRGTDVKKAHKGEVSK